MKRIIIAIFILIGLHHAHAEIRTNHYLLDWSLDNPLDKGNDKKITCTTSNLINIADEALIFNSIGGYKNYGFNPIIRLTQELLVSALEDSLTDKESFYSNRIYSKTNEYLVDNKVDDKLKYKGTLSLTRIADIFDRDDMITINEIILCSGETGILIATGCAGTITWTGGGTPNGSSLSVNATGTFIAICTFSSGGQEYSTSDTTVVSVNPLVNVNVNDLVLCTGNTGSLTASGCTGSIMWSGGGTPDGSVLSVNASGTYIATCKTTYRGKECSRSDEAVVIVNSPVTVSVNDLVICYGTPESLTATGCAGTVTWNTGASGSSIFPYASGTYIATCRVIANGRECVASDQAVVKVNPQVTVTANDMVLCHGTSGTLTALGCPGTITWSGGGIPNGSTLTVNATGTYIATCTVTANGKQCSVSDQGKVLINSPINLNVDDIIVPPGSTGTLTATGCNGNATVTWAGGGTPTGSTLSVNSAGTYTATCKVTSNGRECSLSDSGVMIIDNPTNYVEFGTNNTRNPSAIFDAYSKNKGILLPRIDFNNRPTTNLVSGLLIYVIANGPQGNNCFYYYNGTSWIKLG